MKRTYSHPTLQAYGSVLTLTLGSTGAAPDFINGVVVGGCTPPPGTTGFCSFTGATS
jgi:hypothetical protein